MFKSDEMLDIAKAAKEAGVSANAVRVATFRARQKGNDFNELVNKICNEKLMAYTPRVTKALVKKALKGSNTKNYFTGLQGHCYKIKQGKIPQ